MAAKEVINLLSVRVRFPMLPVEYYTTQRLPRVGNKFGRTLKVDGTTLFASRVSSQGFVLK